MDNIALLVDRVWFHLMENVKNNVQIDGLILEEYANNVLQIVILVMEKQENNA
jgi:hypothetical protein